MKMGLNPKVIVSIVYVLAMFMVAMDGTVLNVALRTISEELGIQSVDKISIQIRSKWKQSIEYQKSLAVIARDFPFLQVVASSQI
jgi:hypothetical protein